MSQLLIEIDSEENEKIVLSGWVGELFGDPFRMATGNDGGRNDFCGGVSFLKLTSEVS